MALVATFNFPLHTLETEYPESGQRVRMGRGYEFATRPRGPDQTVFTLTFKAMWFFFLTNGSVDRAKFPTRNMQLLDDFYQLHRLYEPFVYPHDILGNVNVRFKEPLRYKVLEAGRGQTEPFSVKFILQP